MECTFCVCVIQSECISILKREDQTKSLKPAYERQLYISFPAFDHTRRVIIYNEKKSQSHFFPIFPPYFGQTCTWKINPQIIIIILSSKTYSVARKVLIAVTVSK